MQEANFDDFELIGEGGFSAVYKAVYRSPTSGITQIVAVKKITVEKPKPKLSIFRAISRKTRIGSSFGGANNKALSIMDVDNEVDIFESMSSHKFVLDFIAGVYCGPEEYWIVAEYALGDLHYLIKHSKSLPRNQKKQRYLPIHLAKHLLTPILLAVQHLHQNNIVHRDIKEDNILITSRGIPKLTDFGAAKRFETLPIKFAKNGAAGTFYYMAPEVLRLDPYTTACDTWGLGITFLSVVYGGKPFELVANFNLQKLHEFLTKKVTQQNVAHANNTRRISAQNRFYRLASLTSKPIDELKDDDFEPFATFVKKFLVLEFEGRWELSDALKDDYVSATVENWQEYKEDADLAVNSESKQFLEQCKEVLTLW